MVNSEAEAQQYLDESRLRPIMREYELVVTRLGRTHGDVELARDAAQDVLVKLLEKPSRLDGIKNYQAFLTRSVSNRILDLRKREEASRNAIERVGHGDISPAFKGWLNSRPSRRAVSRQSAPPKRGPGKGSAGS